MCGLVGVLVKATNGFTAEQNNIFDTLLFLDQLRGEDSTGVFSVTNSGEVFLAKEATDATEYRRAMEYEELLRRSFKEGAALIGHNRKATRGNIVDDNAHPFVVDDRIVLVHNGSMRGDHKKFADVEVDSHAIAHLIHKHDGDVQKAMQEVDAAYALIWYDFQNGTLSFLRNNERPLWWVELESCYVWCSEKSMLEFALGRYNIKPKDGPKILEEDTLLTFTLNAPRNYPMWKLSHEKLNFPKKSYYYDSGYSYMQYQRPRRNRFYDDRVCAYENEPTFEDVPFEMHPLERLPQNKAIEPPTKINQVALDAVIKHRSIREQSGGTTAEKERKMFEERACGVEFGLFRQIYQPAYPHSSKCIAIPFDFGYANTIDGKGGFYMYSAVVNDADVVVRHFWEARYMEEDKLIRICNNKDYVYEFLVGTKRFVPLNERGLQMDQYAADEVGGVLLISDKATLKWGGGIGEDKYNPKNLGYTMKQMVH